MDLVERTREDLCCRPLMVAPAAEPRRPAALPSRPPRDDIQHTSPLSQCLDTHSIYFANNIMAPTKSNRTLRIQGITPETSVEQLQAAIESIGNAASRRSHLKTSSSYNQSTLNRPTWSLARQNNYLTSTISFASADMKTKAIKKLADDHASWELDDQFASLTTLYAPENIDME